MGIKSQLVAGMLSAALGLTLVGGGTWAYFNDTAEIRNHFATGTLDLKVGAIGNSPINFNLGNMKPGDSIERKFELKNIGSLAIKEVLMELGNVQSSFGDGSNQNTLDFLGQFKIDIFVQGYSNNNGNIIKSLKTLTLRDLQYKNETNLKDIVDNTHMVGNRINIATTYNNNYDGIPLVPGDTDSVTMIITFVDDGTNQNRFQDKWLNFSFMLEATQWAGVKVQSTDMNGDVNNRVDHSAGGDNDQPSPRTVTGATYFPPVVGDE